MQHRNEWPPQRITGITVVLVTAALWGAASARELPAALSRSTTPAVGIAALLAALKLGGFAIESAYYAFAARAWGARPPVARVFVSVAFFSLMDLVRGWLLTDAAAGLPLALRAAFAGADAAHSAAGRTGFSAAFGSFGVLVLVRLVGTADAVRRLGGSRAGPPFAAVAATWLATRLAMWWGIDLLRGASRLGGG